MLSLVQLHYTLSLSEWSVQCRDWDWAQSALTQRSKQLLMISGEKSENLHCFYPYSCWDKRSALFKTFSSSCKESNACQEPLINAHPYSIGYLHTCATVMPTGKAENDMQCCLRTIDGKDKEILQCGRMTMSLDKWRNGESYTGNGHFISYTLLKTRLDHLLPLQVPSFFCDWFNMVLDSSRDFGIS